MNRPKARQLSNQQAYSALHMYHIDKLQVSKIAKEFKVDHTSMAQLLGGVSYQDVYREFWRNNNGSNPL